MDLIENNRPGAIICGILCVIASVVIGVVMYTNPDVNNNWCFITLFTGGFSLFGTIHLATS